MQHKGYLARDKKDRAFYLSCWGANTHHAIVFSLAIYNFLNPICESKGIWTWFKDETCMMTMDKRHVHVAALTAGYLIYDGII